MLGVRLDSGDLAYLSIETRKILDAGGFPDAAVIASNDLDEYIIESLKTQGAAIDVWGVGTRLVTGHDQPALGGVYKLSAVRRQGELWQYKLKLSEQAVKVSNPGVQQVRRFRAHGGFLADMIYDEPTGAPEQCQMVDPIDNTRRKTIPAGTAWEDLLGPVLRQGQRVYEPPSIEATRERVRSQLGGFHDGIKRLVNPHRYPVGLEAGLFDLRTRLMLEIRGLTA
jgi:nicotinate phosphoribosyltransferase